MEGTRTWARQGCDGGLFSREPVGRGGEGRRQRPRRREVRGRRDKRAEHGGRESRVHSVAGVGGLGAAEEGATPGRECRGDKVAGESRGSPNGTEKNQLTELSQELGGLLGGRRGAVEKRESREPVWGVGRLGQGVSLGGATWSFRGGHPHRTQVVVRGLRLLSRGPISSKFPNPVLEPPGPPYGEEKQKSIREKTGGRGKAQSSQSNPVPKNCLLPNKTKSQRPIFPVDNMIQWGLGQPSTEHSTGQRKVLS